MHTIVGWYEDDDENPSNNEYDEVYEVNTILNE